MSKISKRKPLTAIEEHLTKHSIKMMTRLELLKLYDTLSICYGKVGGTLDAPIWVDFEQILALKQLISERLDELMDTN
ncbi:Oidioi.mRNA.OKI2018_I69.PAR.g13077.t1.cds [Oikopleura dioica]|uniref:Oidioi.mRNA.OKI2018_I69.PAR.g13077.t1.cds n=1 Tax=Oikopleura dioica TaxID=34765 RepID=A0ABN7S8G1_OIKDI|nr:Oidioi.mRNA.OKI2018_I69.PAR.g13077.t1.cds [Oikopleura dioica]